MPRFLFLCDYHRHGAATIRDHVRGIAQHSEADFYPFCPVGRDPPSWLDLGAFDGVFLHYAIYLLADTHLSPAWRAALRAYPGYKAGFLQDEYRQIDAISGRLAELGIRRLFTCVAPEEQRKVYRPEVLPELRLTHVLTGYVPAELRAVDAPPPASRPLDIGYRGREGFWWLGDLFREKHLIAAGVQRAAPALGLKVDVSTREQDRIYGDAWHAFLKSCRATLGTESGANVFDFDGEIERRVRGHLAEHPAATYREIHETYLAAHEGKIRLNQVSPRVFEAAAFRTALALFPGEYSGLLTAGEHYFPLEKDFSNLPELARFLRDDAALEAMTTRAFDHLIGSRRWEYPALAARVDAAWREDLGESRPPLPALRARSKPRAAARALYDTLTNPAAGFRFRPRYFARRLYRRALVHPELRDAEWGLLSAGLPPRVDPD